MTQPQEEQPERKFSEMGEAGISNNFYLVHKESGAEVQVTIRWPDLWDFEAFNHWATAYLEAKAKTGWIIKRRNGQDGPGLVTTLSSSAQRQIETGQGVPVPPPPPAPNGGAANGTRQESVCVLVKVGESYTGKKMQLQFECNGLDRPLTYTKSPQEMATLMQPLGFTVQHIQMGAKYAINAVVVWEETPPNAEGKRYKNVISVRPNAG